jgi:hypothetical protein
MITTNLIVAGSYIGLRQYVIEELLSIFRSIADIQKIVVYVSRAKGSHYPGSDID